MNLAEAGVSILGRPFALHLEEYKLARVCLGAAKGLRNR
jgi:hypothetical protein